MTRPLFGALVALMLLSPQAAAKGAIDGRGVAGLKVGMSLKAARATLPKARWAYEHRFMVDFSADCVMEGAKPALCLLVEESETRDASAKALSLVVLSRRYATKAGVRVGTKLSEAEKAWGPISLSFHTANESREYARFKKAPKHLSVRAYSPSLGAESFGAHVGLYPEYRDGQEYFTTAKYRPDAVIYAIWID